MKGKIFAIGMVVSLLLAVVGGLTPVTAQESSVTRTLPSGAQTAGSPITVSLDVVVGSATYYAVDEEVPTGWTVTSASDAGDFTAEEGHVKWVVTAGAADKTYTYTVTIPGDAAGSYPFTGVYAMEGVSSTAIGGDTTVTVGVPTQGVSRTLPSGTQPAGSTITVSLDVVVGSATYYAIDEEVPTGWTVTSASDAGDFTAEEGHVKWFVTSGATDKTYTYTVTIPADATGDYAFTGVYAMEGVSSTAIGGDTTVTVGVAEGPTIVSYTITPPTITPPETTEIDVAFSERVEAWIKIEDVSRNLVNELYHSTGVTDPDPKTWYGKYANGTIVAEGDYYVNVTGLNTTTGESVVNNTETITVQVLAEQVQVSDADGGYEPAIALGSTAETIYVAFEDDYVGIDFAKSTDGGDSFNLKDQVSTAGEDVAIATDGGNNVYIVWEEGLNKIYYARSTNGGDSFGTKVQVSDAGGSGIYNEHPDIAVDSNGVIYVVWDYDTGTDYTISIDKSTDGTTFGTDVRVDDDTVAVVKNPSIAIDSSNNILVAWCGSSTGHVSFANSTDGGATFTPHVQVDDSTMGATDPSIVVDPANSDKVYVAWQDARAADGGDIYAAASSDGGAIFGAGVKVNDDTTSTAQKFPCMAVNSSGAIFTVWQDGRNYTSSDYDVYFAGSTDGGSTFSGNRQVSPAGTKAVTPTLTVDDTNAFVAWRNTVDQIIYFRKGSLSEWTEVIEEAELTTITVSPSEKTLNLTEEQVFTATAYDQDDNPMADVVITWASSNTTVGTVSPTTATTGADGTATTTFSAEAEGTTTVVAGNPTIPAASWGTASVTVGPVEAVLTTITVSPETPPVVLVGETEQFTATAYDQFDEVMPDVVFTWGCLNETVGTIDDTGLFTALANGTTTIGAYNASVGPSISGTATVTVSDWTPWIYDEDDSGTIDYDEAIDAVQDYFDDQITKDQAILVINLYFG